jgi:hypothetical protein
MKSRAKWTAAAVLICTSAAMASITLDFNVASSNTGPNRLIINGASPLTFAFSVDGSGNVTLDASTTSPDQIDIDTVNGWDGAVGTVSVPSLFNSSFTLQALATDTAGGAMNISLDGADTGVIAIQGQNASRIDGVTLPVPKVETLSWTLTSGSVALDFQSWVYGNSPANIGDMMVLDADSNNSWYNMPGTTGTLAMNGISLAGTDSVVFMEPLDGTHGAGLAELTFDVVPEPATFSLMAICGAAVLMKRRIHRK